MCGIYAVSGGENVVDRAFSGITRLDYRGYDSWGLGFLDDGGLRVTKQTGYLPEQVPSDIDCQSGVALAHTRWATHGGVTQANAHPHISSDKTFMLAHNGVVENTKELRAIHPEYTYQSETDSEVMVAMLQVLRSQGNDMLASLKVVMDRIAGRNAVVVIDELGGLYGFRKGSPLVLGIASDYLVIASDVQSMSIDVEQYAMLDDRELFAYEDGKLKIIDRDGANSEYQDRLMLMTQADAEVTLDNFDSHFLQEIHESPEVVRTVADFDVSDYDEVVEILQAADEVLVMGSGTAGMAAAQTSYYLRELAGIKGVSVVGAETQQYLQTVTKNTPVMVLSQSGETADVLAFLEALPGEVPVISYVNMPGAMISARSKYAFMAQAGVEKSVMSTKVFVSQVAWGYRLAMLCAGKGAEARKELLTLADEIEVVLHDKSLLQDVNRLADSLFNTNDVFLLGSGSSLALAGEGMIKLTEGTYIHAHALAAGDLKHYAITLMEPGQLVWTITPSMGSSRFIENAIHEVKARGAEVVRMGPQGDVSLPHTTPVSDLTAVILIQLVTHRLATLKGNPIDKPRNIAKSVTVL